MLTHPKLSPIITILTVLIASLSLSAQENSLLLDGYSDRVQVNDSPSLDITDEITIEAWVYSIGKVNDFARIIHKTTPSPAEDPWDLYGLSFDDGPDGDQHAIFNISTGDPGSLVGVHSNSTIPIYQWIHIAGTYDGDTMKIYIDGTLENSLQTTITIGTNDAPVSIGRLRWALDGHLQGMIDELRLWNRVRSAAEIQSSMSVPLAAADTVGLVGYWAFNTAIDGIVPDLSQYQNEGYLVSDAAVVPDSPFSVPGSPVVSISPTEVDFGTLEQGTATSLTVNVTNLGDGLLIGTARFIGENLLPIPTVFAVPAGDPVAYDIQFRAIVPGAVTETITIESNGGAAIDILTSGTTIAVNRFDGNNIGMWIQRNGRFARDPITSASGFEWPLGSNKFAIYASGIWVGAEVDGGLRLATASYSSGFEPGPIIDGLPADPDDSRYRVYKISEGDNAASNPDYAEWPSDLGAPILADGSPALIGSQTLWVVYNDADFDSHNSLSTPDPLGVEVQQTVFGFAEQGALGDALFMRFKIINKSNSVWNNAYLGLWSDPDLGDHTDDLVASDPARDLAICFNGTNDDDIYGSAPPALGYMFLQTPDTEGLQAFIYHTSGGPPNLNDASNPEEAYNYLTGRDRYGDPLIDPTTGQPTQFALAGDPVTGIGWVDENPSDRRFLMSSGPFVLQPGETRDIFAAIIVARGSSNLNSVTSLRNASDVIRDMFAITLTNEPHILEVSDVPHDQGGRVTLIWSASALDRDLTALPYYSIWRGIPVGDTFAWENLAKKPAHRFQLYSFAAETLFDSTSATDATHYFLISAHTADPDIFYDSEIANGYSVDNLAPPQPQQLAGYFDQGSVMLGWSSLHESDLRGYRLYRSASPDFDADEIEPFAFTSDTTYVDQSPPKIATLYYAVRAEDIHDNLSAKSEEVEVSQALDLAPVGAIPTVYALHQNYPNPFNPSSSIRFDLPEAGDVGIVVYDVLGREVKLLVSSHMLPGYHRVVWDGRDAAGSPLPTGIYIAKLVVGEYERSIKMLLLK